ncbi:hypothetical protein [Streptomyces cucumeris]|uniref:hypothetical protein n=1 Tax=Streptomyces cucumeris TaxID=2962890 RepID=UPI003D70BDB7
MTDALPGRTVRSSVWVEERLPGYHRYPAAPPARSHLASRHRHVFRVRAEVLVRHDDRDIEFMDLAEQLRQWWGPGERELGSASCEAVARELGTYLTGKGLPVLETAVAVADEGGARVTWSVAD